MCLALRMCVYFGLFAFFMISSLAGIEEPEQLLLLKCWSSDLLRRSSIFFYSLESLGEQNLISLVTFQKSEFSKGVLLGIITPKIKVKQTKPPKHSSDIYC